MPFYFRKSKSFGPLRINLSKSGVGTSIGGKGFRVGKGPKGAYVRGGRDGVYFQENLGGTRAQRSQSGRGQTNRGGFLQGKQRLILVALAVVLVVVVFQVISSQQNRPAHPAVTAATSGDSGGGTTATADEIKALKSYGLQASDLPPGVEPRVDEEFRNYAAAAQAGVKESEVAGTGRVDGYYQVWQQNTADLQFLVRADLFDKDSSAMTVFLKPISADANSTMQPLADPKLGDASRMFAFTTQSGAEQFAGWAVQWVRGRTVFDVRAVGPPGELQEADVLKDAKLVDGRAAKTPIK